MDYEYGLTAAQQYLTRRQQTAAFITADVLSMGFVGGSEQKVCVPDDIYVSFDDVYLANMTYPSTTVHQDIGEKGRKAAAWY